MVLVTSCKTRNKSDLSFNNEEIGLVPVKIVKNSIRDYIIVSLNDTLMWSPKQVNIDDKLDCKFIKELLGSEILVLSGSTTRTTEQNISASSIDNLGRDLFYFIDLSSKNILKLKMNNNVVLSPYKSWLNKATDKIAIKELVFKKKKITFLNSLNEEIIFYLEDVEVPDIFCLNE